MLVILHEDTHEGSLSAVYYSLSKRIKPGAIRPENGFQRDLFDEYFFVETNLNKVLFLYDNVQDNISNTAADLIRTAAMSFESDKSTAIFNYLLYAYKHGSKSDLAYGEDSVLRIWQINKNVMTEYHKYLGFLRFTKLKDDIYYARAEPKNEVIMLLADHFSDRMKNEKWIIHDTRRMRAAVYNTKELIQVPFEGRDLENMKQADEGFEMMWCEFLKALTIRERINYSLQNNNMPKRYRRYMTEFLHQGQSHEG